MPEYWDKVLIDLKHSGLTTVTGLFEACVGLCEKYAGTAYWECADRCHDRFNVARAWTLELV